MPTKKKRKTTAAARLAKLKADLQAKNKKLEADLAADRQRRVLFLARRDEQAKEVMRASAQFDKAQNKAKRTGTDADFDGMMLALKTLTGAFKNYGK